VLCYDFGYTILHSHRTIDILHICYVPSIVSGHFIGAEINYEGGSPVVLTECASFLVDNVGVH